MNLLILSGGSSTRTDFLSKVVPKFLTPIWKTNLLFRQIDQALDADIENIFISTKPELYQLVKDLCVNKYGKKVFVIKNPSHKTGILNALLYSIDKIGTKDILISLSDIFYSKNPFNKVIKRKVYNNLIFAGHRDKKIPNYSGGGVLTIINNLVMKLDENSSYSTTNGAYWNGLIYLNKIDKKSLKLYLKNNTKVLKIGDYFNTLITQDTLFVETGMFINCNTLEQLYNAAHLSFLESNKKH